MGKSADLKVFITTREATCDECGEALGRRAWITLEEEKGATRARPNGGPRWIATMWGASPAEYANYTLTARPAAFLDNLPSPVTI